MVSVQIPSDLYQRMSALVTGFRDTEAAVLSRLLDFWDQHHPSATSSQRAEPPLDRGAVDLAFCRPCRICVAGQEIDHTWNNLVRYMIGLIPPAQRTEDKLRSLIRANYVVGYKRDKNYCFVEAAGVSVQGLAATPAWRAAEHLAESLGVPVTVEYLDARSIRQRLFAGPQTMQDA